MRDFNDLSQEEKERFIKKHDIRNNEDLEQAINKG